MAVLRAPVSVLREALKRGVFVVVLWRVPHKAKGHWSTWWNNKIYNLYRTLNILYRIKIRRVGLLDHIKRKEDERISKKVLNGKVHNTRPVGKTKNEVARCPEKLITEPRNKNMETSRKQKNGGIF
jgi:hypothetical protein